MKTQQNPSPPRSPLEDFKLNYKEVPETLPRRTCRESHTELGVREELGVPLLHIYGGLKAPGKNKQEHTKEHRQAKPSMEKSQFHSLTAASLGPH